MKRSDAQIRRVANGFIITSGINPLTYDVAETRVVKTTTELGDMIRALFEETEATETSPDSKLAESSNPSPACPPPLCLGSLQGSHSKP